MVNLMRLCPTYLNELGVLFVLIHSWSPMPSVDVMQGLQKWITTVMVQGRQSGTNVRRHNNGHINHFLHDLLTLVLLK